MNIKKSLNTNVPIITIVSLILSSIVVVATVGEVYTKIGPASAMWIILLSVYIFSIDLDIKSLLKKF